MNSLAIILVIFRILSKRIVSHKFKRTKSIDDFDHVSRIYISTNAKMAICHVTIVIPQNVKRNSRNAESREENSVSRAENFHLWSVVEPFRRHLFTHNLSTLDASRL